MSILINGIPLGGYEISIMKDGERYRARVDGIWCEVEEIATTDTDSDTISRAKAIDGKICIRRSNGVEIYDDYVVPVEYLEQLPPAEPEPLQPWEVLVAQAVLPQPKMGKWIYHIDDLFPAESTMECNQCHAEQPLTCDDEFCPHCGAKMEVTT